MAGGEWHSREEWDRRANSNARTLAGEIESLERDRHDRRFGEFWKRAKGISSLFKSLKPLRRNDREKLWAEFGSICEAVKSESREEAKSNTRVVEREISSLEANRNVWTQREFWIHAKEISNMFRAMKPLWKEERERLWARFDSTCKAAKGEETNQSRGRRELVEGKISAARAHAEYARNLEDLSKAENLLSTALAWIKPGWDGFNFGTELVANLTFNKGNLTREDRAYCWEQWKSTKDTIRHKRQELCQETFRHFERKALQILDLAKREPNEAKEMIKETQRELKGVRMSRDQFQQIRNMLNKAWESANLHLGQSYKDKHEDWAQRMQRHIDRWTSLLEKNQQYSLQFS